MKKITILLDGLFSMRIIKDSDQFRTESITIKIGAFWLACVAVIIWKLIL